MAPEIIFTKIEQSIIKNSLGKLQAGKRITASEKDLLDRWEQSRSPPELAEKSRTCWLVRSGALAELLGVTQKTIAAWAKLGMPRHAYGEYDFKTVFPWWMENINAGPEDRDATITETKKKYWQEKVENLRIKNEALRGGYVSVEEVLRAQAQVSGAVRNSVRSWASRLPPMLEGKTADEMLPAIRAEVDQSLRILSAQIVGGKKKKRKAKR